VPISATTVSDAGLAQPGSHVLAVPRPIPVVVSRDTALSYLRASIVALVVAHHSAIAYALYIPTIVPHHPIHPWLSGIPIFDSHRVSAFDLFALFNDIFFMSLMFFVSGLFVWPSLARKGSGTFLRDRSLRLGLPFVLCAVLAPLAYYPAYRLGAADPGFAAFCRDWLSLASLGVWPAGPVWFVWVLLLFDAVAAGIHRLASLPIAILARVASGASRRPAAFFAVFMAVSAAAYLPPLVAFGPNRWVAFGPFSLQASRFLLYFVYFLAGVVVGAGGIERGLLARDGRLGRQWPIWVAAALALYLIVAAMAFLPKADAGGASGLAGLLMFAAFVLCCGACGFALLALFRRFANARSRLFDSLSDNAYGIYLVHYGFVLWLQYALLPANFPAIVKAALVFSGALALSWGTTAALRRIPAVARVI